MSITEILGIALVTIGLLFYILGVIGLVRFPDVYSRIHASGKVSTLGIVFFCAGAAVLMPATTLKVLALAIFMIISQPVASHAVASAAFRSGVEMHEPVRNDLQGTDLAPIPGRVNLEEETA